MTDRPDPAKTAGSTGTTPGSTKPGATSPGTAPQGSASTGATGQSSASTGASGKSTASTGSTSEGMADTARRTASDAADAARGVAAEQTERAKGAVADEVSGVAHALRTAADDLREGSAQERTFAQIADTLADTAEAIRDKDLGEMMEEATRIARRHPMTFLGGAALLGFTAMRFAKASRDDGFRRNPSRRTADTSRPGMTPAPTPASTATSDYSQAGRVR